MLTILAHRGVWSKPEEQNTLNSFEDACRLGVGIETDIRDIGGEIMIAHDPGDPGGLPLKKVLQQFGSRVSCLALNIKAAGLGPLLAELRPDFPDSMRWFTFDHAVPDLIHQMQLGLPFFPRQSELEDPHNLVQSSCWPGIFLDELTRPWVNREKITPWAMSGVSIALVSPELHGRPYEPFWFELRKLLLKFPKGDFLLCTDHVQPALQYFQSL